MIGDVGIIIDWANGRTNGIIIYITDLIRKAAFSTTQLPDGVISSHDEAKPLRHTGMHNDLRFEDISKFKTPPP